MIMEPVTSDYAKATDKGPYVDLTKPIANWFKPTAEKSSPLPKVIGSEKLGDKTNLQSGTSCKSIIGCGSMTLKGFDFCHKHILEDKSSPFRRCSFISKSDYRRCRNPTPILGEKRSYCVLHDKERKRSDVNKNKNKKKKKRSTSPHDKASKKRPSTLPVSVATSDKKLSSSEEEEFSFFTDTVQVNKTDCLWLGNQASDAESTDSEDENLLNHAGVWTLEECIRILKEKMSRIRYLYALQYKTLNHCLKEERRKMLKEYDMDAFTLSKVGFDGCSDASFDRFVEGVNLTNYQKFGGPELIAEKISRTKGVSLHTRKNDLPRCMLQIDGHRCFNKMLPLSKFCYSHVCNDPEQHLFYVCTYKFSNGKKCMEPANTFSSSCHLHDTLSFNKSYEKSVDIFQNAKQRCENRKRKMVGKEREKKEPRAKRSSARLKECSLSLTSVSDESLLPGNTKIPSNINIQKNGDNINLEKCGDKILQEKSVENSPTSESNMTSFKMVKFEPSLSSTQILKEITKDGNIFEKGLLQPIITSTKAAVEVNVDSNCTSKATSQPTNHSDLIMPAAENKSETNTTSANIEDPNEIHQPKPNLQHSEFM